MENIIIEYKDKKNSSATVKNGQVILRISSRLSKSEQQKHINNLLQRFQHKLKHQQELKLETGIAINFYGIKQLWLNIKTKYTQQTRISVAKDAPFLEITKPYKLTDQELKPKITKFITKYLKAELKTLIEEINQKTVNQKLNELTFRNFGSRWGHCNYSKKSIALSTKLAWVPYECFEYVIIHELCHLIQPNHSAAYWAIVQQHCPNYKQLKKELIKFQ